MSIQPTDVFVVSGGARGITAECVIRMAQQYQSKFILLGRSKMQPEPAFAAGIDDEAELKRQIVEDLRQKGEKPLPRTVQKAYNAISATREIQQTLQAIQEAGGTAEYVSVDVTDGAALKASIDESAGRLGTVTGILHGAGALADKLIEKKTPEDFELVYSVKVHGLENLLNAIPNPQYLILFSSVAGFGGNIGQADYAIANDILNKVAFLVKQQAPNCRVISFNWGPWDAGMVTPELKAYFLQNGIKVIPLDAGAQILIDELDHGDDATKQVVIGSIFNFTKTPDATLRTHRISRTLRLEESPMLADHVVNSQAVLPMVCAMSWMGNMAEDIYPGYHFARYDDYRVLKGIVFDENLADSYTLELKETEKAPDGSVVKLTAVISSQTKEGKPRFHYSANLVLQPRLNPPFVFDKMDLINSAGIPGDKLYQDKVLFHRWSFKGVQEVLNISPERTTMRCWLPRIPEAYQGQFQIQSFNYFGVDAALQSLGTLARLEYGMGSLPLSAEGGAAYRQIPWEEDFYVTLIPRETTEAKILGDLTLHDENGLVYFEVIGCHIALSKRLIELFERNTLPEKA